MTTGWAAAVTMSLVLLSPITSNANELYVNQVGDDFTMTIVQEGKDNSIGGVPNNTVPLTGDGTTMTMTQQGNDMVVEGYIYGADNTITIATKATKPMMHLNKCSLGLLVL